MGTGYTRADTANNIADGNIINASDLDSEYDAIQSAFDASTGHTHDGTAGEGAPIETIGPSQDVVATASVLRPKTDNTVDLGTTSLEYKDLFLDGTAHIDTLDVDENASITGTLGVTGATTLSSTLGVTGATTLSSTLGVTGATTLSSTLGVTGAATLSSTLAVTGATGIDGDFDINTNKFTVASATGNTAVAGTLGVTGATTATGGLNVDTISEITSANGVVIDGVTLKDGGATVTADITFGDNDKVIFGAGSDLQIYHDGSNNSSYIKETGAGSFNIEATNLFLKREGGTENFIDCVTNGAVTAYYDGSPKLATTSTGVNITGTLTSDGLTVSPSGTQQVLATLRANSGSGGGLVVQTDASDDGLIRGYDASGNIQLQFDTDGGDNYIAQGNVGIGNSSPATALDVTGRTTTDNATVGSGTASTYVDLTVNGASTANYGPMIELQSAGTAFGKISNYGRVQGGTSTDMFVTTSTTNNLILGTNNAERMRIDSSGRLGIGTSSPSAPLDIAGTSGTESFRIGSTVGGTDFGITVTENDGVLLNAAEGATGRHMKFATGGTEAMRIDSSGNLLVGTTDSSVYNNSGSGTGINLQNFGNIGVARDGNDCMVLNRLNSDGDIAVFNKDGATVGSIGALTSDIVIGSRNDVGFKIYAPNSDGTSSTIHPIKPVNGAAVDAKMDLGYAAGRFKDLYLSGGVYLGGTGSANLLDDYEEGTFTPSFGGATGNPTVTYTVNEGYYRKVGDLVFVQGRMTLSSTSGGSGSLEIDGLPFTPVSDAVLSVTRLQYLSIDVSASGPIGILAASLFVYYTSNTTGNHTVLTTSDLTNTTSINFSGCYAV